KGFGCEVLGVGKRHPSTRHPKPKTFMVERCSKCGAELFAGQQFCRRCGAAVNDAGGDAPTQILPQGAQGGAGAAVGTSPFGGAGLIWWVAGHAPVRKVVVNDAKVPDVKPPMPPAFGDKLGEQIERAIEGSGATASPLDESGATVTGTDTVLSMSFEIGDGATFSMRGVSGDVTVTGSDGDRAELKITKHGGSPAERAGAPVLVSQTDKGP